MGNKIFTGVLITVIVAIILFWGKKFFIDQITLPIWTFFIMLTICLIFIVQMILKLKKPKYREDFFDGIRWRWDYYPFGGVKNLYSYCSNCDTLLVYYDDFQSRAHFKCDSYNCKLERNFNENISHIKFRIEREIERKVRNKEY